MSSELLSVGRCSRSCNVCRHPTYAPTTASTHSRNPTCLLLYQPTNFPTCDVQDICSAVCLFGPQADAAEAPQPSNIQEGRALKGPKGVLNNSTPEKLGNGLDMGVLTEGSLGDQVLPRSVLAMCTHTVQSHSANAPASRRTVFHAHTSFALALWAASQHPAVSCNALLTKLPDGTMLAPAQVLLLFLLCLHAKVAHMQSMETPGAVHVYTPLA